MGLGKTVQAAVAIKELFDTHSIRRVLIVCPLSLSRNWRREIKTWAGALPVVMYEGADRYGMLNGNAPILVGSYETVAADLRSATSEGQLFCDIGVDLIILDEAQRIKDPDSTRSRVLGRVVSARRWAISGTPLENHPRELSSLLRFLFPNEFSDKVTLDDLSLMLARRDFCMVRRTKDEVGLQLPPRTTDYVPIALTPDQAAEYDRALLEVQQAVLASPSRSELAARLLSGLQKLRRIAAISANGCSAKLDYIEEKAEELRSSGEKLIVFSSFPNLALKEVSKRLARFGPVLFTGEMSQDEREAAHERFLKDPECGVMCASLRAAGVGFTWVVARYVYHLDLWWNPQVIRQAEDRIHRIGQSQPVFLRRLVAERTIDEGIAILLERKEALFRRVVDDEAIEPQTDLPIDHLLGLIGLRPQEIKGGDHRE
jgi:SNF2 family DNA or RNA helicase